MPLFTLISFANEDKNINQDIIVNNLSLKISLIETAYEIYNLDALSEKHYEDISKNSHNHYKWLNDTKKNLSLEMINKLDIIFKNKTSRDYIETLINIDDNSNIDEIISYVINNKYLNFEEQKAFKEFFSVFYKDYFHSYFLSKQIYFDKKTNLLNNSFQSEDVNLINFIENISGQKINKKYKSKFYYSLNPINNHLFINDENLVATIADYNSSTDIVRICSGEYTKDLFSSLLQNQNFINLCYELRRNSNFTDMYQEYREAYTFEEWCIENLTEGFIKYLDYRFYNLEYDFSNYYYDLEFFEFLKENNFDSKKDNLMDISIQFYESKA